MSPESNTDKIGRLRRGRDRLQAERDDLLRAIEAHMAEMDMRALKPGRDRVDIDNDLYNVATRIREFSGPAAEPAQHKGED